MFFRYEFPRCNYVPSDNLDQLLNHSGCSAADVQVMPDGMIIYFYMLIRITIAPPLVGVACDPFQPRKHLSLECSSTNLRIFFSSTSLVTTFAIIATTDSSSSLSTTPLSPVAQTPVDAGTSKKNHLSEHKDYFHQGHRQVNINNSPFFLFVDGEAVQAQGIHPSFSLM